jgi:hypothetical protein
LLVRRATPAERFSGLVRLGIAGFTFTGEVLASVEWIREVNRPFNTDDPDDLTLPACPIRMVKAMMLDFAEG